ncbi:MAG TPA: hypothetical protein VFU48_14180, partial [Nitrospira sp.]|nr:hypothetical protein [Nitrospira sp.]
VRSNATLNYRLHSESFSRTKGEKAAGDKYKDLMSLVRDDFAKWNRKPSLSAICAVSKPHLAPLALKCWQLAAPDYKELVLGCSPSLPDSTWSVISNIPRSRACKGTDNREDAGLVRFGLLDAATGDWIANVDDDDIWLKVPDLTKVPADVGMISGSGLFFEFHVPPTNPSHVEFHQSLPLEVPGHAHKLRGSHWIVRRKAWEQISKDMDRSFWFSDWRLAYRIIEAGWRVMAMPEPLGVVRRYSMDYPTGPEWTWDYHVQTLSKAEHDEAITNGSGQS